MIAGRASSSSLSMRSLLSCCDRRTDVRQKEERERRERESAREKMAGVTRARCTGLKLGCGGGEGEGEGRRRRDRRRSLRSSSCLRLTPSSSSAASRQCGVCPRANRARTQAVTDGLCDFHSLSLEEALRRRTRTRRRSRTKASSASSASSGSSSAEEKRETFDRLIDVFRNKEENKWEKLMAQSKQWDQIKEDFYER